MNFSRTYHLFFLLVFLTTDVITAQITEPRYWIEFTDKNNSPYSINRPEEFLSQRAIDRRARQGIAIIEQDLPVNQQYIDSLVRMGLGLINISKWNNGASFSCKSTELIESVSDISFVANEPELVRPVSEQKSALNKLGKKYSVVTDFADYGPSYQQIGMLKGDTLHSRGYQGQEILIGILDSGFDNADSISSLQHIWEDERIWAVRDFVKDGKTLFASHGHGTLIFTIIGGIYPSYLHGSATQANFALIRTEEHTSEGSENIIEEYNWISGAEFADSLGVDIISSSLGYSYFDDPSKDHSYEDMDGQTTPISIGANIAASKGMLVVTSAGNAAGPPWYKITAPADADNILAVGAVDSAEIITSFSSRGPSYDGRVKPDVCAMGYKNISQHPDGRLVYCTGTSCSAPVISGLAACLWQAHPEATYLQIVEAISKSSDRYMKPDSVYGYGLPDFSIADIILSSLTSETAEDLITFRLFPNPVTDYFYLEIIREDSENSKKCLLTYIDLLGQNSLMEEIELNEAYTMYSSPSVRFLPTGIYTVQITYESLVYTIPFMKIR